MSTARATSQTGDLRAWRLRTGLSQQSLAQFACCSVSAVRLIEKGYAPTRSPVRERIVEVLASMSRPPHEDRLP